MTIAATILSSIGRKRGGGEKEKMGNGIMTRPTKETSRSGRRRKKQETSKSGGRPGLYIPYCLHEEGACSHVMAISMGKSRPDNNKGRKELLVVTLKMMSSTRTVRAGAKGIYDYTGQLRLRTPRLRCCYCWRAGDRSFAAPDRLSTITSKCIVHGVTSG